MGSSREILWETSGAVPEVTLEFSRDGFYRDVNLIASGVPNTGAAAWTVPDAVSEAAQQRRGSCRLTV